MANDRYGFLVIEESLPEGTIAQHRKARPKVARHVPHTRTASAGGQSRHPQVSRVEEVSLNTYLRSRRRGDAHGPRGGDRRVRPPAQNYLPVIRPRAART